MELASVTSKKYISLDPRTKFILLLIAMAVYLHQLPNAILLVTIGLGVLLIVLSGQPSAAIKFSLFFTGIIAINYLTVFLPAWLASLLGQLTLSVQFFMPIAAYMILLIKTTSVDDVSTVLSKLYVPQFLAIPILVMMRFIPTIGEEYRHIRQAMVFRGIGPGFKNVLAHPIKTVEYIYVPLLFSLVRIGEELTMSALTRGLGLHSRRTVIRDMCMSALDYAMIAGYITLYLMGRLYGTTL